MIRYYFLDALFILLGLALVAAIIKYPKDFFIKLPLALLRFPIRLIQSEIGLESHENDKPDEQYPSTKNLKVDFRHGDKYVYVISFRKDLRSLVKEFLEMTSGSYVFEEFQITGNDKNIIRLPGGINFYDYHLFVQYLDGELGERKSFGVFKSDKLTYYVFQDSRTLNNLIGFTADRKLFSIYMLDDLDKKQHLKLNQKLVVETEWIDRVKE